jgi:hydroxyacyl-ACP dehydratase HTD2-like protein with hotdog domain
LVDDFFPAELELVLLLFFFFVSRAAKILPLVTDGCPPRYSPSLDMQRLRRMGAEAWISAARPVHPFLITDDEPHTCFNALLAYLTIEQRLKCFPRRSCVYPKQK